MCALGSFPCLLSASIWKVRQWSKLLLFPHPPVCNIISIHSLFFIFPLLLQLPNFRYWLFDSSIVPSTEVHNRKYWKRGGGNRISSCSTSREQCSAWDQTQNLIHARQNLFLVKVPNLSLFFYFDQEREYLYFLVFVLMMGSLVRKTLPVTSRLRTKSDCMWALH